VGRSRRNEKAWADAIQISSLLVGLMFLITILNWLFPIDLRVFGIVPRTLFGLVGIFLGPLLHLGFGHLLANAFPLWVLLMLLFAQPAYYPERTLGWVWIGSGFGTWLIGRGGAVHIGASSLIYGLVVYFIAAGWWMRNWRSVFVAIVVLIFYGGIFYGVLPQRGIVSWEGHLAGAITGLLVARSNHG
jgi:membrane associated rhomboid family serine protease